MWKRKFFYDKHIFRLRNGGALYEIFKRKGAEAPMTTDNTDLRDVLACARD